MINFKELKISPSSAPLKASNWNGLLDAVSALPLTISADKKNIGIGNVIPIAALHIADKPTTANKGSLIIGPTDKANLRLGYHANYTWIQSHGSKPLAINPLGNNVGIGTNNPLCQLSLGSTLGRTKLALYQSTNGKSIYGMGVEAGRLNLTIGNPKARYAFWDRHGSGAKEVFTIRGNGRVGIGVNNPISTMHVKGQLTLQTVNNANRGYIVMLGQASNDSAKAMLKKLKNHQLIIGGAWNNHVYFYWKNSKGQHRRAMIVGGKF